MDADAIRLSFAYDADAEVMPLETWDASNCAAQSQARVFIRAFLVNNPRQGDSLNTLAYRALNFLISSVMRNTTICRHPDAASQIQLRLTYQALAKSGGVLPRLHDVGFKVFSQSDEDGILLYIFSIIGTRTKASVEVCAGSGLECNTANLIINHGWNALLVDGNASLVRRGIDFYRRNPHTYVYPPRFVASWVTRENVNEIISTNGFKGEIDLLSIDMDGIDYWIWEAIQVIDPRVVVVEYQDIIGPEKALTVPYDANFKASSYPTTLGMPNFCGASLPAFVKLAAAKGYRLVGCNRYGYNAFFIKKSIGEKEIPEIDLRDCFTHPKVFWGMKERFPTVEAHPWVEV
jgi:hypothetical protein